MAQGVMDANCTPANGANAGSVGRHFPTAFPPTLGGGVAVKPSVLRQAQIASATVCPQATPFSSDRVVSSSRGEMAAREAVRLASKLSFWAGNSFSKWHTLPELLRHVATHPAALQVRHVLVCNADRYR